MSPLRITMVSFDDEPALGGQGVVVGGMRRALTSRGVDVITVAGRGARAVGFPRITGRAPLDLSIELNRHPRSMLRGTPAVVHAHGGPGGVLLVRPLPLPLVYTAHHTYRQAHARGTPRRALSILEGRAYRRAAMVLPVSSSTAMAVRSMGVAAARIEVVSPGIDPPESVDGGRRDPGRLLFAGRLEPEKGVLDAVAVMGALTRGRTGVSGAVVGTGSLEARVRAAAAGLPGVDVLGSVDDATLAAEYARAAIVLMPSRYEGLGLVALEAMAAGAAVVGYDVEGLRDVVGPSGGGVLVPAGGRDALLEVCRNLLDGERRDELAERGRAHVLAHHAWPVVGERLEQIHRAVIASW